MSIHPFFFFFFLSPVIPLLCVLPFLLDHVYEALVVRDVVKDIAKLQSIMAPYCG
jgi:hypothetical protein